MPKARQFVAPRDSAIQQELLRRVSAADLPADSLRQLLRIINADGELLGFSQVGHNLRLILLTLADCWPADLPAWADPAWPDLLRWIDEKKDLLLKCLGSLFDQPSRKGRPAMWGFGAKRHSQYTAFSMVHENTTHHKLYALLQGHLLYACTRTQEYKPPVSYEAYKAKAEWPGLPGSLYSAALVVRLLSRAAFESFLERLPLHLPPVEFAKKLGLVPCANQQEEEWCKTLTFFFRKALGIRNWPSQWGRGKGKRKQPEPGSAENGPASDRFHERLPDRVDALPTESDVVQICSGSPTTKQHKQLLAAGEHYTEEEKDRRVWVLLRADREEESAAMSPAQNIPEPAAVRVPGSLTRAQRPRLEMLHQLLPDTYAALSVSELTRFRKKLHDWLGPLPPDGHPLTEQQRYRLEIALFLETMIWTGSLPERAQQLRVLGPLSVSHNEELAFQFKAYTEPPAGRNYWQVRALEPKYQSIQAVVTGQECPRTSHVSLPELTEVSAWLRRWLQEQNAWALLAHCNSAGEPPAVRCFPHTRSWYEREVPQVLAMLDPTGRITETNLSRWLFFRVVHLTQGDVAGAALVCGWAHELSEVRRYYDTRSLHHLQQLYRQAVAPWADLRSGETIAGTPAPYSATDLYVGSRLTPTLPAVAALIRRLLVTLETGWDAHGPLDGVRYHNYYTLYTVGLFSLATAVRAIRTPYLSLTEVDQPTGLATFSDKNDEEGSKTRLLWVPPLVVTQMEYYREHVRALGFPTALPCFLLDEQHRIREVRPRTVQPMWAALGFPFPANFYRHFLRSQLIERGCTPESVDAFMGHWYYGEEPWGEFSSFCFEDHVDHLRQYLLPLFADLSLRALRSRPR